MERAQISHNCQPETKYVEYCFMLRILPISCSSNGNKFFSDAMVLVEGNGATSKERWCIIDADDGLEWALFYYAEIGRASCRERV